MSEGDVLATIDGALRDWELSDDAMRWTADESVLASAPTDDESPALTAPQLAAMAEMSRGVAEACGKLADSWAAFAKAVSQTHETAPQSED